MAFKRRGREIFLTAGGHLQDVACLRWEAPQQELSQLLSWSCRTENGACVMELKADYEGRDRTGENRTGNSHTSDWLLYFPIKTLRSPFLHLWIWCFHCTTVKLVSWPPESQCLYDYKVILHEYGTFFTCFFFLKEYPSPFMNIFTCRV